MALFLPGGSFKNNLGSTHKVEKVLSSLLSSITTFVLDLGCLFVFFGSKTVLGSTHVVEQLLFFKLPSIMTFHLT